MGMVLVRCEFEILIMYVLHMTMHSSIVVTCMRTLSPNT